MPLARYKVLRDGETWSLGYPTKSSAQAAAKRLKQTSPGGKYTVSEMNARDYETLADLEKLERGT